ncbi:hypothetical protein CCM_03724 [Cordyceps militaris CM01]|uniref:Uncharacterized protein n=1 Tax=Cordyceps militaris (strain CM01) TaxID=983644 RepID=G3JG74_CORMM|nr:uncharacterized protein CCM_03724 [Cordyceps militaris CM01]EGX92352.1 hypothetical protein CCM_03724 [Cordyceps militaris CM01]
MVLTVYLVIYHSQARRRTPAHWSIMVTEGEREQEGFIYHVVGSKFTGYQIQIKEHYNLAATNRRHTVVLLGCMDEAWLDSLEAAAHSIALPKKSPNLLDPFAGEGCQTWAGNFVQHLVDLGAIDQSAIGLLGTSPTE